MASVRAPASNRWVRVALTTVWALAAVAGLGAVAVYSARPGEAAVAAAGWPAGVALSRSPSRPTLVLALHPECPCSRATIAELARVQAKAPDAFEVVLLVVTAPEGDPAFLRAPIPGAARAALPGARLVEDRGGALAERFGARTSGQALLFAPGGALLFRGGLTAGRGHEGDNDGSDALLALAKGAAPGADATPVYGCPLFKTPEGTTR